VPIPPVLVTMLRHHDRCCGTAPDGRMFRGTRGGPLSESSYGRTWHAARSQVLGPAAAATSLVGRPYDLRHAALSLWLNAGAAPAQIAQRAGHSITTLLAVYTHCIDGQDDITNRQIEHALQAGSQAHCMTASGSANRRYRPEPVRHMSVRGHTAHPGGRLPDSCNHGQKSPASTTDYRFRSSECIPEAAAGAISEQRDGPDLAHAWPTTDSKRSAEPLLPSGRAAGASPRQRL